MQLRPIEGMMKRALHYKLKAFGGPVRKVLNTRMRKPRPAFNLI